MLLFLNKKHLRFSDEIEEREEKKYLSTVKV